MLRRAAANAGPNASEEEIAKHYVAPELAKYFRGTDTTFLQELNAKAQPMSGGTMPPAVPPSALECTIAEKAFKKVKKLEFTWAISGAIAVSTAFVIWFSHYVNSLSLSGYIFAILIPGLIGYSIFFVVGSAVARTCPEFKEAISVAGRILATEWEKTSFWKNLDWRELEHSVAALFTRKGYRAYATPRSGDRGVDVVAESSSLKIVIQCKQYSSPAQRSAVSELLGVQVAENADKSILVCTGGFTSGAEAYADENGIILWDLNDLAFESAKNNYSNTHQSQ